MQTKLHYNTVTPLLLKVLKQLMEAKEFKDFRLVGGTSLSLQRGHRLSVDIDLFTDAKHGTIDFESINAFLKATYAYVDTSKDDIIGFGKSYFVGTDKDNAIKLDVFYTDKFIDPILLIDDIRMASVDEIIAMKLDVINRGGRKKDFWDIHELIDNYSVDAMFFLHKTRYPYGHDRGNLRKKFIEFANADDDFDPICLRGKHWELIRVDIEDFIEQLT
jgi:predicted nucleotidyltransferase component of viral defense system